MKRISSLYPAYLGALVSIACSQAGPVASDGAGAPSTSGTSATTAGSGGAPNATGGTPTGGAPAGGTSSGATGGTPTTTGGTPTGGAPAGGTSSGATGGTPTTGGTAPTGGAGAGTGGGSGGGGGGITPADIVPDLDGFVWEGTCAGSVTASGKNCPFADDTATSCPSTGTWAQKGATKAKSVMVKGTPGQIYTINFEVRGVVGTRCYTGGTPGPGFTANPVATGPNNTWYIGGTQYNDSIWNTYQIDVTPAVAGEANTYYANGFPMSPNWCQKEASYEVGYKASFKVTGGGTINFSIHDANCQAQQNCGGNDASTTCDAPRTVNISDLSPAGTFAQPRTNQIGSKTYYPQWLYFDVQSVTSP